PAKAAPPVKAAPPTPAVPPGVTHSKGTRGCAVVVHGIPTHRQLGDINRALGLGRKVGLRALRWLLPEERRQGKKASSLVLYLTTEVAADTLVVRMAGRKMRTCMYDWDRGTGMDTGMMMDTGQ